MAGYFYRAREEMEKYCQQDKLFCTHHLYDTSRDISHSSLDNALTPDILGLSIFLSCRSSLASFCGSLDYSYRQGVFSCMRISSPSNSRESMEIYTRRVLLALEGTQGGYASAM
jgi:hypothetical protein